jgi:hypothetical protein
VAAQPVESPSRFERVEARLRAFAAVVSPSIVGILIIVCVIAGEPGGTQLSESEIVSSVALLVGAVLVLGSTALYLRSPDEYERLQKSHAEQVQAVAQLVAPIVAERIKGQPALPAPRGDGADGEH